MRINKKLVSYLNSDLNINFTEYFYGIEINQKDIKDFEYYSKTILYKNNRLYPSEISRLLNISKRKIEHWLRDGNKPFIFRLLEHYLTLGKPEGNLKWISVNSTRGGLFTGPWIKVPDKVENYHDVLKVITQLKRLTVCKNIYKKENLFAYFLGMLIGDSSKTGIKRSNRTTRRVHIRLSKGFPSNEKLGEFASLCANSLGLRMNRCKDCPAGKKNTNPFYTWISQSSPLIQWIFKSSLGLKDNELTTYNPVKADWILNAPKGFKISFIQGLADSDGFVDFSGQQAGIITEPNTSLIKRVLNSLNIHTTKRFFTANKLWSLMINITNAYKLPLFNPIVKSYRYEFIEKLFKAKRITGHWPLWLSQEVEKIIKEGHNGTEIVKMVLDCHGIAIRTKSIQRRAKKIEQCQI